MNWRPLFVIKQWGNPCLHMIFFQLTFELVGQRWWLKARPLPFHEIINDSDEEFDLTFCEGKKSEDVHPPRGE